MIKTILFDMGNVLVRFSHGRMVRQLSGLFGAPEDRIKKLVFDGLGRLSDSGEIPPQELYSRLCRKLGVSPPFRDFRNAWSGIFSGMPGAEELIKSLNGRYRLILASDTNEMHFRNVQENFPFINLLEDATSYKMGAVKPELISRILEKFSLKPEECAFFDDLAEYVDYARSLGIRAVLFKSMGQLREEISRF